MGWCSPRAGELLLLLLQADLTEEKARRDEAGRERDALQVWGQGGQQSEALQVGLACHTY